MLWVDPTPRSCVRAMIFGNFWYFLRAVGVSEFQKVAVGFSVQGFELGQETFSYHWDLLAL